MDYSKLSDEELLALKNKDYSKLSNETLLELKNEQTQEQQAPLKAGVSIDVTPSGIAKGIADNTLSAVFAPLTAAKNNISIKEGFRKNKSAVQRYREENPTPIKDTVLDVAGYTGLSYIPGLQPVAAAKNATKAAKIGNWVLNSAKLGAIPGIMEGYSKGGFGEAGKGALIGSLASGGLLAGIPVVGKVAKKGGDALKWAGQNYAKNVARLKPKTIQQLVKPNSKALDLTEDEAMQLLTDTTRRVRSDYNDLLGKKADKVETAIKNLRKNNKRINADDLIEDITSTFDQYKGENINPAINSTGYLEGDLVDIIEGGKPIVNIDTANLPKYTGNKNQYNKELRDLYFKNAKGSTIEHPERGDIYFPRNGAGEAISNLGQDYEQLNLIPQIKEITQNSKFQNIEDLIPGKNNRLNAKSFDIMRGRANVDGSIVDTDIKIANTPQGKMFYTNEKPFNGDPGFTSYGQPGDILGSNNIIADNEAYFNSISPIDLQRAKQQIGQMVNWEDQAAQQYKNPILEQIYGKFDKRLSDLSPELAAANEEYAFLRDFQKNDGVNQILRGDLLNSGKVGTAPTALRNYGSNASKGIVKNNIQDLEKLLVENGYNPFLNDVDDVNAALNLLNSPETGINKKGGVDFAKLLTRPAFRAIRKYNQSKLPAILQNIGGIVGDVSRRVVPATLIAPWQ